MVRGNLSTRSVRDGVEFTAISMMADYWRRLAPNTTDRPLASLRACHALLHVLCNPGNRGWSLAIGNQWHGYL